MELRIDENEQAVPIEVNPMRFAGWCTTDIAFYAYGINVYEYFFNQKEPDWKEILTKNEEDIFSIVIADIPKNIDLSKIIDVDYNGFASGFSHLLELRKINYKQYPVFAFAFIKTSGNFKEIDEVLKKDFRPYIKVV